ncbi:hypothetical protein U1Q18_040468 [Sarracenia purpurea var. burkii]
MRNRRSRLGVLLGVLAELDSDYEEELQYQIWSPAKTEGEGSKLKTVDVLVESFSTRFGACCFEIGFLC